MLSVTSPPAGEEVGPARICLLGPFRLTDSQGRDCAPRSAQQQAMLAILALAPGGTVSRAKLKDMLWGEKDPKRAAQSLRTALSDLRKALESRDLAILEVDNLNVRLRRDAILVDLHEIESRGLSAIPHDYRGAPPDLVEGINLRGQDAEGFEDWLRRQRSYWEGVIDRLEEQGGAVGSIAFSLPATRPAAPKPGPQEPNRPILGLLQPVVNSSSANALFLGEALLDRVAIGLREYCGAICYDYRDLTLEPDQDVTAVSHPSVFLRLQIYEHDGDLSLRIVALKQGSQELLWSINCGQIAEADTATVESERVTTLIGETVDRISTLLSRQSARPADEPLSPFHAMTAMFQLDHDSLVGLRQKLFESWELSGAPIYPAILAYLNTFAVGEHWRHFDKEVREETRAFLASIREGECTGIGMALAGHATGYVLHDREGAGDLLEQAIRTTPHSAFCWDHLALHKLYDARYEEAHHAAAKALKLGAHSPLRFTLETTLCMINTLEGRFDLSSVIGNQILNKRPNFGAALRYTSVSLAHLGRTDQAHDYIARIRGMDPEFSREWVKVNRMAVRDSSAKRILEQGLMKAGA
jgi:tetratricopeptide (TPR) repeat protein